MIVTSSLRVYIIYFVLVNPFNLSTLMLTFIENGILLKNKIPMWEGHEEKAQIIDSS